MHSLGMRPHIFIVEGYPIKALSQIAHNQRNVTINIKQLQNGSRPLSNCQLFWTICQCEGFILSLLEHNCPCTIPPWFQRIGHCRDLWTTNINSLPLQRKNHLHIVMHIHIRRQVYTYGWCVPVILNVEHDAVNI